MTKKFDISFNKPNFTGKELHYISEAIWNGQISGGGLFTSRCQELLQGLLGVRRVLLTTSCTHALEMAALALDIRPGDEVIVPSYTFVSTANAFALRGARLVFGDVRPDTLNLDEKGLERLITGRTKAIAVVHYAGVACEMDSILELAGARGVPVVEDNAHGLFARYKGKNLGSMGCLAAQSFHETKNFTCGEGGALIVNDPSLEERAEIIREKGTDRSRFFRGQVDKYTWVSLGSSYVPSDILAAFLFSQLESRSEIQAKRRGIWERYHAGLREWAQRREIGLPYVPRHCEQSYHMFYLILPSLEKRQALIRRLKSRGIQSVFHYSPLHLSGMGRFFGARAGDCPVAESMGDRLLRLPFFNTMTEEEQAYIVETIQDEGV